MILDAVATAVLSPILLLQAVRLRKRALRLPEASGPRQGSLGNGPPLSILIVGDSSAAGVGAQTQETALVGQMTQSLASQYRVNWHLIARTGATTPATLARLKEHDLPFADLCVVVLGVNDVTRGGSMSGWLQNYAEVRTLLRQQTGAKRIYVCQVPPLGSFPLLPHPLRWLLGRRAIRFDAALDLALRAETDTEYVPLPDALNADDMAEDGFHPGPIIYAAWAQELARRILQGQSNA